MQKKLPGEAYSDKIRARFWLVGQNSMYIGIGRMTLLEKIEEFGSINQAAKEMSMSYKKAWKLVDELNQLAGEPVVIKIQGGVSGGGTVLTEKGVSIMRQFRGVEARLKAFLENESKQLKL